MENRKSLIVFFVVTLGISGFPFFALGYDAVTTHAALTKEVVSFYNLFFARKIPDYYKRLIIKGSIDEDATPRYLNHFYDPVYNRGWEGEFSSKIWAKDSKAQSFTQKNLAGSFFRVDDVNDFSWERGLKDYAAGDVDRAFLSLGHALHLLEDASVPEHTRNDTHVGHGQFGSPFENWAERFTPQNIDLTTSLYQKGSHPLVQDSLEKYFDDVAQYSNKNFFSEDTIQASEYLLPKVIVEDVEVNEEYQRSRYGYGVDEDGRLFRLALFLKVPAWRNFDNERFTSLSNDAVLNDYWDHLSRKAVLTGAGVVNLFLEEAVIARGVYQRELALEKQNGFFGRLAALLLPRSPLLTDAHTLSHSAEFKLKEMAFLENQTNALSEQSIDEDEAYEKSLLAKDFKSASEESSTDDDPDDDDQSSVSQTSEETNDALLPQKIPLKNDDADSGQFPQKNENADKKETSSQKFSSTQSSSAGAEAPLPSFTRGDVRFSEIAWMGTANSANDEWIELYNATTKEIPLEGWRIQKGDGTLLVGESGDELKSTHKILAGGYFLLERNEGATSLASDKLYDGSLNNAGETLILQDANGNEIDRIDMLSAWQAGSNNVASQGYKPTMSFIGNTWKDGVPTPRLANTESLMVQAFKGLAFFSPLSIVINEIAWMGNAQSSANEWIELFNNATSTIDVSGWTLKSLDGSPAIMLSGFVSPGGYILLERTDDNSVPQVTADAIYTGALEDAGEILTLNDPAGNEIDRVDAWYAGDKTTKTTMQRESPFTSGNQPTNWFSASGTPRAINTKEAPAPVPPLAPPILSMLNYQITNLSFSVSWALASSTPAFSSFEVQSHDGTDTSWKPFYSGTDKQMAFGATRETIYTFRARILTSDGKTSDWAEIAAEINPHPLAINEIMYNPDPGSDDYYEYVELYNRSASFIDLSKWTVAIDAHSHALKSTLGSSLILAPGGFALVGDKPSKNSDPNIYDGYYDLPASSSSTLALTIDSAALSLRNTSSRVSLEDASGTVADDVLYSSSWGANGNGRSLERINPSQGGNTQENWKQSEIKGTPNRKNLAYDAAARPGTLISDATVIASDTLWTKAQSPYLLESNSGVYPTVSALATLYIEPGVSIKPLSCCYTALKVSGNISAKGTSLEPIVITSSHALADKGDWGDIFFENNLRDSFLSWVIIEYGGYKNGGSGQASAMLTLKNARIQMDRATVRASQGNGISIDGGDVQVQSSFVNDNLFGGIYVASGSPLIHHSTINRNRFGVYIVSGEPIVESNTLNENDQFPIYFFASAKATFHDNLATGNGSYNGIYVTVAGISEDTSWTKDLLPYILESNAGSAITVNASTTLTLEPGVIIKPFPQLYDNLIIFGTLNAKGSVADPIVITSIHDDAAGGDSDANGSNVLPAPGDWRRILFKEGSSGLLSTMSLFYGGYGNVGAVSAESGAAVQTSSINFQNNIKDSQGIGG